MSEPLLCFSQELDSLQQDYETYLLKISQYETELNNVKKLISNNTELKETNSYTNINNKNNNKPNSINKNKWFKDFTPKLETLDKYLNVLNAKIKHIECSYDYKFKSIPNHELKKVVYIKEDASKKYEDFHKNFLYTIKSYSNLSKITNKLKSENNNINDKERTISDNSKHRKSSGGSSMFKTEIGMMRNEDLEKILHLTQQTLSISKDMKNSMNRTDGSLNTIEKNVLNVKSSLQNANNETNKYYNRENKISPLKYITISFFIIVIVIALLVIYLKFN